MNTVVGIDEVGRGCWAGPLVAAAVLLEYPINGLKDSKKIPKMKRKELAELIHEQALSIGIGWVFPEVIDKVGLTRAVSLAMSEALSQVRAQYDKVIIDGNFNYLSDNPFTETLVHADDVIPSVSAASIVAKVVRDEYMAQIAEKFPQYGFEQHVGYGTAQHIAALKQYGTTEIHRMTYKPIQALSL